MPGTAIHEHRPSPGGASERFAIISRKWTRYYSIRGNETAEIYNTLVKLIWDGMWLLFRCHEPTKPQFELNVK